MARQGEGGREAGGAGADDEDRRGDVGHQATVREPQANCQHFGARTATIGPIRLRGRRRSVYSPVVANGSRDNTAAIHRQLREAILHGEIEAGAELSQVKLADDFGVSRGPVREALRLLEREGLVEAELNCRVRVASFSPSDLEELYALRIVNEALGVRASVRTSRRRTSRTSTPTSKGWRPSRAPNRALGDGPPPLPPRLIAYSGPRIVRLASSSPTTPSAIASCTPTQGPRAWSVGAAEHARSSPRATLGRVRRGGCARAPLRPYRQAACSCTSHLITTRARATPSAPHRASNRRAGARRTLRTRRRRASVIETPIDPRSSSTERWTCNRCSPRTPRRPRTTAGSRREHRGDPGGWLFKLMVPKRRGGYEVPIKTKLEVSAALAEGCGRPPG